MKSDFRAPITPIRSSWKCAGMVVRGPLTDKKIEKYREQGWYSPEFRQARREMFARRKEKQERREGNFLVGENGRLVFSPQ